MTAANVNPFERIRAFWDERARQFGADGRATLRETHLREVEVRAMMKKIAVIKPARVLDVGCWNGWSTRQYARAFPETQFVGVDFSGEMIRHAKSDVPRNCEFRQSDVLDRASLPFRLFEIVMTQRCLQ